MHPDEAARQREGVRRLVLDDVELPVETGLAAGADDPLADPPDHLVELRVRGDSLGGQDLLICLASHFRGLRLRQQHQLLPAGDRRSEEHTSELQSLMRKSYAVFCLKKKKT